MTTYKREYYIRNREKYNASSKAWRLANPDYMKNYCKEYRQRTTAANREKKATIAFVQAELERLWLARSLTIEQVDALFSRYLVRQETHHHEQSSPPADSSGSP